MWSHTTSCFKIAKLTGSSEICHYSFPRECESLSRIDESGFHSRRPPVYEYMNGFNPTIMGTFRCNHDVQLLLAGSGATDRIYYCCKHVTKTQKQTDSMAGVVLAAFQRREEREAIEKQNGSILPSATISRRRVGSMAFNTTNRQEVAGPLAVLYLLQSLCCYRSNDCCQLPLWENIKQLQGEGDYSCSLVEMSENGDNARDSTFCAVSILDNYLYRPHMCDIVNLYEFAARAFRRRKLAGTNPELFYLQGHPLKETHCMGMHVFESVPLITGFQIPRWKDDTLTSTRERYAAAALVLFRPFRCLEDLLEDAANSGDGWIQACLNWRNNRSDIAVEIMSNSDDYYAGKEKADRGDDCGLAFHSSELNYDSDESVNVVCLVPIFG
ncbi:hypothetical protein PHMEG_00016075 [Phytophthora megakarya]|uniref:Uncharacterized protein n=1 Tax=Phytophthora megakarya TaxID=4795 RepID=A0A225W0S7_9STRA|nr:hypothetical protein PHMEG_00016075 [Phytophthora megakarya]